MTQRKTVEANHHRKTASTAKPAAPVNAPTHPILRLQRTFGNQAVQRLLHAATLQAKLRISQPGDVYEQEADNVAEQVMRMPAPGVQRACAPCAAGGAPCPKCAVAAEDLVQRKTEPSSDTTDTSTSDNFLESLGPGQPLDSATRAFFEPRFNHDFSRVRIHTDAKASESAQSVSALAYTVGRNIVFAVGNYVPGTPEGRRLLAHELTHVVQQGAGRIRPTAQAKDLVSKRVQDGVIQRKPDHKARILSLEEIKKDPRREKLRKQSGQTEAKVCKSIGKALTTENCPVSLRENTDVIVVEERAGGLWLQIQCAGIPGFGPKEQCHVLGAFVKPYESLAEVSGEKKQEEEKKVVPSSKCSWPPADPAPLPAPDSVSAMLVGTQILPVLTGSYKEHDQSNRYLDNAFWGSNPSDPSTWPCTLWEALKSKGLGHRLFFKAIFKVTSRVQSHPDLWSKIKRIKNCWDQPSNHGFEFDTLGDDEGLKKELENSQNFCRDFPLTEAIYHKNQYCWREISRGGEGLHFCLGKGLPANVHIDLDQPASGKIGGYCQYDPSTLKKHGEDVAKED